MKKDKTYFKTLMKLVDEKYETDFYNMFYNHNSIFHNVIYDFDYNPLRDMSSWTIISNKLEYIVENNEAEKYYNLMVAETIL